VAFLQDCLPELGDRWCDSLLSSLAAPVLGESLEWAGLVYFSIWLSIAMVRRLYAKKLGIDGLQQAV